MTWQWCLHVCTLGIMTFWRWETGIMDWAQRQWELLHILAGKLMSLMWVHLSATHSIACTSQKISVQNQKPSMYCKIELVEKPSKRNCCWGYYHGISLAARVSYIVFTYQDTTVQTLLSILVDSSSLGGTCTLFSIWASQIKVFQEFNNRAFGTKRLSGIMQFTVGFSGALWFCSLWFQKLGPCPALTNYMRTCKTAQQYFCKKNPSSFSAMCGQNPVRLLAGSTKNSTPVTDSSHVCQRHPITTTTGIWSTFSKNVVGVFYRHDMCITWIKILYAELCLNSLTDNILIHKLTPAVAHSSFLRKLCKVCKLRWSVFQFDLYVQAMLILITL